MPSFTNYFYYYLTEELGFSDLMYSLLNVAASVCLIFAIYLYNRWFKEAEPSIMLFVCCLINALGGLNTLLLIKGFTYGLPPDAFVFLTTSVTDTLSNTIRLMSGNVLFAKLIPLNIEASMFSILMGLINFCNFFLAKQLGNFFNLFVGVTQDNLDELWILEGIMVVCSLIPIFFIWLIPKRKEVFLVQQINEFL